MRKFIAAILSLALIVSLTACTGSSSSDGKSSDSSQQSVQTQASSETKSEMKEISFPAYTIEKAESMSIQNVVAMVNDTPPFIFSFPLEKSWEIKTEKDDETLPTGEFYTPVYIYESEKLIGYIAFSPFLFDFPDDTPKEGAYPLILPNLSMSSQSQWNPYTAVKAIKNGEVGVVNIEYMDPNDIANHPGAMPDVDRFTTTGIVAYDIELRVSVAIAFMPDIITEEQATEIAKKVEFNPAENN